MRLGAYDFIVKPPGVDKLVFTLRRAIVAGGMDVVVRPEAMPGIILNRF